MSKRTVLLKLDLYAGTIVPAEELNERDAARVLAALNGITRERVLDAYRTLCEVCGEEDDAWQFGGHAIA